MVGSWLRCGLASVILQPQLPIRLYSPIASALSPLPEFALETSSKQGTNLGLDSRAVKRRTSTKQNTNQGVDIRCAGVATHSDSQTNSDLSGEYLVQSPNVFRGLLANGQVVERPRVLSAEEQQEVLLYSCLVCMDGTGD